jgi:amidase
MDPVDASLQELQAAMQSGATTSESLVATYLERIEKFDRSGPGLNAVIEVNPDAHALAARCDRERSEGHVRSPLHGIPVLLKDNIATADRMQTTAGSLALLDAGAPRDAGIVTRLRMAGAVILGKTNLSEWANFRSWRPTSGWSSRGGLTRNPHALDRSAGGSSSGSAVAVAASLAPVAVGTETDGSIVSPSAQNGIVGIKPTHGLSRRCWC